ncbi:MAG: efflux RND transporter periplasmic adaptor subunit [Candidatus Cryptobacteroides sp.]
MAERKAKAFAAIICGCITLYSCNSGQSVQQDSKLYESITLKSENIELSETYPASIEGRQDISIYPQVSGTISKVCVKEGQKVRKGQSLFVIDQVPFKAALQIARANVQAAEAGVATSELLYNSRVKLHEKGVISDYDLQTSYNQLLTAKAQLAQARAQEVTAQNNMTYTMVLSPADGVVGTLPYREGALVSPSIPVALTTVSDNSVMYVYFSLTENRLLELTKTHKSMDEALENMPETELRLNDGSIYSEKGYIETISGIIDRSTGSVSVRAVFKNPGGILHSGASGNIVIPETLNDVIIIPCSATFELQDQVFAYRVIDGKAVATRLVTMLTDDGKKYVVKSGLEPGDIILAEGVGMVRDGQEIRIKEAAL